MSNPIHDFRYFIVGSIPVKLALSENGGFLGTLGPDKESETFNIEMKYFSDVMDGDGANEVDQDTFDKACLAYFNNT